MDEEFNKRQRTFNIRCSISESMKLFLFPSFTETALNSVGEGRLKVMASCPEEELLRELPVGCHSTMNNLETVEGSDLIVIAVKPNIVRHVLGEVSHKIDPKRHIVMSIAAGVKLKTLEEVLLRIHCYPFASDRHRYAEVRFKSIDDSRRSLGAQI